MTIFVVDAVEKAKADWSDLWVEYVDEYEDCDPEVLCKTEVLVFTLDC